MKIINKRFLPYALVGTMMLAGCGKEVEVEDTNIVEPTTQATTEAKKEEQVEAKVIEATDYYSLAAESYNNYTEFYAESGMAYADENADQGINIERIENAIKVIDGEVSDLTASQIKDAKEDISYILFPQTLKSDLDNVVAEEKGYVTIEGNFDIASTPLIDLYAENEETREFVEEYEQLRDEVIDELNATKKVSNETKEALKDAVAEMEKDYLPDENNMNVDVTAEGNKLLENIAKESLVELTALSTNEARIKEDEFPGGLKIADETDEERDIRSKARIHGIEILTDEEKEIFSQSEMENIKTKYIEGECAHIQNLADHAKDNSSVHSQIEELKQYKDYLISQKTNVFEYTLSI